MDSFVELAWGDPTRLSTSSVGGAGILAVG